jgi:hypothetical protein
MCTTYEYDVAISFAGEDRQHAKRVAQELTRRGLTVFFDEYEKSGLWGKDLYAHLADVYRKQARYTIVFLSKHYATKLWTNHERKHAQARAFTEREEYILPIRLDDTEIEGIAPTVGYLRMPPESPSSVANLIVEKISAQVNKARSGTLPAIAIQSPQQRSRKWSWIGTLTLAVVGLAILASALGNLKSILGALTSSAGNNKGTAQPGLPSLEYVRVDDPIAERNTFLVRLVVRNNSNEPIVVTRMQVTPQEVIKTEHLHEFLQFLAIRRDGVTEVQMIDPRPAVPIEISMKFALDAKATKEIQVSFTVTFSNANPVGFDIPVTLTLRYDNVDVTSRKLLFSKVYKR